ncbi:MAG: iron complex outermembrane receptor protein [Candidatus Azotimanducaceae bacterium]|jgi:iron complex outermembrane receptor protein
MDTSVRTPVVFSSPTEFFTAQVYKAPAFKVPVFNVWALATVVFAAVVPIQAAKADHHHETTHHHIDEEIVVSAPFQKRAADTALSVEILSGEALRQAVGNTLGDTLDGIPGIQNASFGTGVGHPVIRGQSGNRVQILQNSVNNVDVAGVSQDHADGVEPLLADRIEVIRGPATLLYGNGAIGGVVNVIDGRIPSRLFDHAEIVVQQSHDANNDENKTLGKINASLGSLSVHLDGYSRKSNNTNIPGFAVLSAIDADQHAEDGDEHADEHEEHEGEQEEPGRQGVIENSNTDASGYSVGLSWVTDSGYVGYSYNRIDNSYGLPLGGHAHTEDESEDEHHDEHDHADELGEESEAEELVRIDLQQKRHDLKAEYRFTEGFVNRVSAQINITDYAHNELEILGGVAEIGTRFENEGTATRIEFGHAPVGNWFGTFGIQLGDTTFSAIGAESFIPETDTRSTALFAVERLELEDWQWELGARVERLNLDAGESCDSDETTLSLSVTGIRDLNDETNVMFGLSRSERAATLEERFSNIDVSACAPALQGNLVEHAATQLFEIGNPNLDAEVSLNLEVGFRKHSGAWTAEINAYYNTIDDYIYLQTSGIDDELASYNAQDALFYGVESELQYHWPLKHGAEFKLSFMADAVKASFDDSVTGDRDVPRIPPMRVGIKADYQASNWAVALNVMEVWDQDDTAAGETRTQGYTRVDLYTDYHVTFGRAEALLFANAKNLTDERIRSHASFLKDIAPEPGRSIQLGIRFSY